MKNTSLIQGVALALTLVAASAASAQSGAQKHPDSARGAQADSGRGARGQFGPETMLLRGIILSQSQKTRLADLNSAQRTRMEATRPPRAPGDTAGMAALREQMLKQREQRVASVRSILDNAQRTQFDKNVAEMKSRVGHRRGK